MNNSTPKLNPSLLTPEQRSQLSAYHQGQAQLQALKDIADMTGEVINVLDKQANQEGIDKLGVLLVDMRESLKELNAKEAPEQPDTSKLVLDVASKLEKALTAAVSAQKAPVVNVPKADAPVVNVDAPKLDLTKVEKILKTDLPKAFEQAIQSIVIPEQDDTATNQLLEAIADKLASIDTGVRMKPQSPATMVVTNPDGSLIGGSSGGLTDAELRATPVEITGTVTSAPPEGAATEDQQVSQNDILEEIRSAIQAVASTKGIASDIRVTLLGGTTAVTGSLTTVTGLTNIGGLPAVTLIPSNQNTTAVLSNINNVSI